MHRAIRTIVGLSMLLLAIGSAQAESLFFARLVGGQEVPPVATGGVGTAAFLLTSSGLEYSIAMDNLGSSITGVAIRAGAAGINGPIVRALSFGGNGGSGLWSPGDPQPFSATALEALFRGGLYVEVQTAGNPGGEIRGQILPGTGLHLAASLDGSQENPAVAGGGRGTASVVLTEEGLRYRVTTNGLTGPATAGHIHAGGIGVNGGVMFTLSGVGTQAVGFVPRSSISAAQLRDIVTGNTYVNVHTAMNPGGEIRGQLLLNGATALTADIDASQEVPPTGSAGKGTAVFSLTPSGLRFEITVDGLSGGVVAAHFHRGPVGVNGPAVRDLTAEFAGTTSAVGVWRQDDPLPLTPALVADLLLGNIYVNLHTAAFPGGEIRGQLVLRPGLDLSSFSAGLNANQEEPPNATTGRGTGYFLLGAGGLTYRLTVSGLSSAITAAHLHGAGIGVNGAVITPLAFGGTTTAAGVVALGAADQTALLNGLVYANVHTVAFPGGEIRGQVVPASGAALEADLTSAQEVPANGSPGYGTGTFRLTRDGLAFDFSADNLTAAITAAHFHGAGRGSSGGVARGLLAGEMSGTNGRGVWKPTDAQPLTAALILDLFRDDIYFNVHTVAFPGGEVRGQVDLAGGLAKGADLSGMNEVPSNGSSGVGSLACVLTSQGMLFRTTVSDLDGAFTAAHFHNAPAGSNGPVVRDVSTEFAGLMAEGVWSAADGMALTPALEGQYLQNAVYFNVHTTVFPGGELRGDFGPLHQPSAIVDVVPAVALRFSIAGNPAGRSSLVRFNLPSAAEVNLRLYDITGREVAKLLDGRLDAGIHSVPLDSRRIPDGVYFYRLATGGREASAKVTIVH